MHRVLSWALQDIAETKHPAFQSRILRAFLNLEEDLPGSTIEEATGAPTDFLVALEALSSAPATAQLIADDPFLAAKIRSLKRKRQMLEIAGGALSSSQVAEVLSISRQAVDKRRSATNSSHSPKVGAATATRASSLRTVTRFEASSGCWDIWRISIRGCGWPSSPRPMNDSEEARLLRGCGKGWSKRSETQPAAMESRVLYD